MSRIQVLSTSEARSIVNYKGLRQNVEWKAGGPARAAGGRNSDFIRGFSRILQIEDRGILSLDLTRLEPRRGRRFYGLAPLPPTHLAYGCVEVWMIGVWMFAGLEVSVMRL